MPIQNAIREANALQALLDLGLGLQGRQVCVCQSIRPDRQTGSP